MLACSPPPPHAFWGFINSTCRGRCAKAEGELRFASFYSHYGDRLVSVLSKFAVYTSAPHLRFMSSFYAFITLDMPDSANHVHSSCILSGPRNISLPDQSRRHPVLHVCVLAFCHLVTQTSRGIMSLINNKCWLRGGLLLAVEFYSWSAKKFSSFSVLPVILTVFPLCSPAPVHAVVDCSSHIKYLDQNIRF